MSRSSPSLIALLGLVAVAGYQNRGRITEMLSDAQRNTTSDPTRQVESSGGEGFLAEIGNLFGAGSAGGSLSSGLNDLLNKFKESGRSETAETWVSTQPNRPMEASELEAAIGGDTLDALSQKTGLSRNEVLLRLTAALPAVVDQFTPDGRVPDETEARNFG